MRLSITCRLIHLAYIFQNDAREILIQISLNIDVVLKINAYICGTLTVLQTL